MKTYRIKVQENKYYPQVKNGLKTLWMYESLTRYIFNSSLYCVVWFLSRDEAVDYITKLK